MGGLVAGFAGRVFCFGNALRTQGDRWPVRFTLYEKALRMSSLLEVSGVSVSFDGFKAINNLSFQIAAAELRAIIGRMELAKPPLWILSRARRAPIRGL